mmetsp:Transcript_93632/g.264282  ORF Transcript_93632/g.264282 Transcript_93632/m.264282 type:complete len:226 (-) Transcript_93632:8-685(-)
MRELLGRPGIGGRADRAPCAARFDRRPSNTRAARVRDRRPSPGARPLHACQLLRGGGPLRSRVPRPRRFFRRETNPGVHSRLACPFAGGAARLERGQEPSEHRRELREARFAAAGDVACRAAPRAQGCARGSHGSGGRARGSEGRKHDAPHAAPGLQAAALGRDPPEIGLAAAGTVTARRVAGLLRRSHGSRRRRGRMLAARACGVFLFKARVDGGTQEVDQISR